MGARQLRASVPGIRELGAAAAAAALTALLGYAGVHKLGAAGLLVPVALVLVCILVLRPLFTVALVVALVVVCEGPQFGLLTFTANLYNPLYGDISLVDGLVALALVAVGIDLLRHRRALLLPRPLVLGLALLALAMVAGAVTGYDAGAKLRFAIASEHVLLYLLLLPIAVANLAIDRPTVLRLLGGATALAIVKAVLGLVEVAGHYGSPIEGATTLTYLEPTANWLIMVALLGILAAVLARARPPLWTLLSSPLLIACLVFSYRRSFWIGAALGLLLVLLLGTSTSGRRLLLPAALGVAGAILLLGSINFQSQLPIVKRVASLAPSKLEANVQDSYRLDERANVLQAIGEHPLTGLGMTIPWAADARVLSVEHEEGRQYVHFAALWFWLKLGILGLLAYVAVLIGAMTLAWQVWRGSREPLLSAFGLASLCALAGLVAIETTASFTGVDPRFTALLGAQMGLLGLLRMTASESRPPAGGGQAGARSEISASIE
ncbi:MAG TPA: O-antigen ligase family protein [Solirubrobacteraceae bacterium]|nr:O-antigen ligase family protein [Solirubrobacteraceae bacterium]